MWRVVVVIILLVSVVVGHSCLVSRNMLGVPLEKQEWSGSYTAPAIMYQGELNI